jgi:hypothetical protein
MADLDFKVKNGIQTNGQILIQGKDVELLVIMGAYL